MQLRRSRKIGIGLVGLLNGYGLFFLLFNQVGSDGLRLTVIMINNRVNDGQTQRVLLGDVRHVVTGGVNGVALVLLIPIFEVGGLVHVFDDLPPAHAGVVGAEGYLAFLRAVGNDTHLGAAEVIVEQILEPHAFNAEHAPVVGQVVLAGAGHPIVAVGI